MNDRAQALPEGLQSVEEISRIMQDSRHAAPGGYPGLQETDDYIDDAMENYEASLDYPEA